MRGHGVPRVAVALSAAWLLAQASGQPWLAAVVVVASIGAACGLAEGRGRRLSVGLAAVTLGLAAVLGTLLVSPAGGASSLLLMLALLVVAGALMPLLYAATFEDGEGAP